jgi:hypothetical protein
MSMGGHSRCTVLYGRFCGHMEPWNNNNSGNGGNRGRDAECNAGASECDAVNDRFRSF